jgi:Spy/CpxP family protein refolding chaperone
MTRKKKTLIGVLVASLVVAAGIGALTTFAPDGAWGKGFHPGCHRAGFHPHGEDVADFILWKMDKHVRDLDLNETQKQEYEKVKDLIKVTVAEAMERRVEFHGILRDEMSKEKPDMNALASLAKERANLIPEMVSKHIDTFLDLYNTLDESQQAQLIEMFRSRMDRPS